MIDLVTERVLSLADAAKILPPRRRGKRPHASTLRRWGKIGFRGILLETIVVGATTCTSTQALQRFATSLTAANGGRVPKSPLDHGRELSEEAVERELERYGL